MEDPNKVVSCGMEVNFKPTKIFPMLFHFQEDAEADPIKGLPNRFEVAATIEGDNLVLVNWKDERVEIQFK